MFRAAVSGVLIILFFVLHNVNINRGLLQANEILVFLLSAILCNLVIFFGSNFLYRNSGKAALFSAWSLVIFLFFGNLQDFFSGLPLSGSFTALKYFLPFCIAAIILLFIFLFRSREKFRRMPGFLFTMGILLLFYESVFFIAVSTENKQHQKTATPDQKGKFLKVCDSCNKPDIYLFILDEYTGTAGLKNDFNYDNAWFESMLAARNFKSVPEARSPYILTIYAMASMLNMDYITDTARQKINDNLDYQHALRAINNNIVCHYLINNGYSIRNLSPFDLPLAPSSFSGAFNPSGISLLYYKTIYGRIKRDLPFLLRAGRMNTWNREFNERILSNNQVAVEEAIKPRTSLTPEFTYTHLFMPHSPFGFDSSGKKIPPSVGKTAQQDCDDYLQYLVYTNKQVIRYMDILKKNTNNGAVIIIASDHGYRAGCGASKATAEHSVLMSYYLPTEYGLIQDKPGTSNIQAFRILFNTIFPQPPTPNPQPPPHNPQQKVPAMNDRDVKQTIDKDR